MSSTPRAARPSTNEKNPAPALRAEVRPQNGAQALFLRGKAVAPLLVDIGADDGTPQIAAAYGAGARLFRLRHVELGWTGPGQTDTSDLDAFARRVLEAAPDADLILEVRVDAPTWWRTAHPAECAGFAIEAGKQDAPQKAADAGGGESAANSAPPDTPESEESAPALPQERPQTARGPRPQEKTERAQETLCASWASRRWLTEAGEALSRLAAFVGRAEWGARVVGYQVAAGAEGTWRHPQSARLPDTGPRMAERFRAFCLDKYRRNEGLLRKGWDDPRAAFDRIRCPSAYERRYADLGILRDALRSRRMLDYYECFWTAQNEAALHFCALLKRITQRQVVVGLAYAAPFGGAELAEGSHGYPEAVFDSPDVDFLVAPPAASGEWMPSGFGGSLRLRGKFWFQMADARRSVLQEAGLAQAQQAGVIAPLAAPATQIQAAQQLCARGLAAPISGNRANAQIAVIVDAAGMSVLAGRDETRVALARALFADQMRELAQTGAPYDVYLLSDLFHPKFQDHKVYVFLNTLYLSEAERRRIEARVKRSAQTVLWIWGPGLLSETGLSEETAQKLTGLKIRTEKTEAALRVRIVEGNDPLTWGLHVGAHFGAELPVAPTLTVGDKTATRLGANASNKTVFAAQRHEHWTSVVYGAFPVPAALLRNAFKGAGVHLFADTAGQPERIMASARLVALHSPRAGKTKVFLPGLHDIADALTGQKLETASEITLPLAPNETRLLEIRALPRKKEPEKP